MKRVYVITGASDGIGLATAQCALGRGDIVYGISRRGTGAEGAHNLVGDVNDTARMREILAQVVSEQGRIDVLVNNAGFGIGGKVEHADPADIARLATTNLAAVEIMCNLALPYLMESKGRIVNVSSVGGVIPLPCQACYSASKAGVEIFSALDSETCSRGVRVVAVLPGDAQTGFTAARVVRTSDEQELKSVRKAEKGERKGYSADKVARAIVRVSVQRRPPLRKSVGFGYKCVTFLTRIVPTRLLNALVRWIYC